MEDGVTNSKNDALVGNVQRTTLNVITTKASSDSQKTGGTTIKAKINNGSPAGPLTKRSMSHLAGQQ